MEFAPLTLQHQSPWADLLAACFDRQPEHMRLLLRWLDSLGEVVAWGAWDQDRLVGQYSCLLRPVRLGDQRLLAGMSINMAVHPDWRGRGLVKHMAGPVYDRVRECGGTLGIGFSNAAGVRVDRHSQRYSYQVVGQMQSMVGRLRVCPVEPLQLTESLPDLCGAIPHLAAHFEKSTGYFHRRYAGHPFRAYRYGIWQEDGDILGIVVYRDIGAGGVALLDAWGADMPGLLARWSTALRRLGKWFVHVLVTPAASLRDALAQVTPLLALPYTRTPYYLTIKPLAANFPDSLLDFHTWDCVGGDVL